MATERIYPDADITTNWDGWSGPPHWSKVDDAYGAETEADGGISGIGFNVEELRCANVASMGASDTCTQLDVYIWCKTDGGSPGVDVAYSTDGGTNWSSAQSVTVAQTSYDYEIATFSGLSLTQSQVNNLAVQFSRTGGGNAVISSAISVLVTYTGGGTAHPYTGSGTIVSDAHGDRIRKVARAGSGLFSLWNASAYSKTSGGTANTYTGAGLFSLQQLSERSRGKSPSVSGQFSLQQNSTRTRHRAPTTVGVYSLDSGGTYFRVKFWVVLDAGTKVYSGGSTYSSTAGRAYPYTGEGYIQFASGVVRSLGRVRGDGGTWVFANGAVYTLASDNPTGFSYSGLGQYSFQSASERIRKIVRLGGGVWVFQAASVYVESEVRNDGRLLEGKPSDGYTKEAVPGRPGAQDGAYTEVGTDGAWTEEMPVGAYTKIGYEKEMKPRRRYTMTKESLP